MDQETSSRRTGLLTTAIVALLLIVFATLSYTAVLGKSATADEPLHVVGAAVHRFLHDYRINFEDPPLLGWWASIPMSATTFDLNTKDRHYQNAVDDINDGVIPFYLDTMYPNHTNHDAALNRSRACFVLLGVALGALIALWAYQLAGPIAAVAAAALFCLDPNFTAHAALVKNDVPFSLLMCATCYALWRFGILGQWRWLGVAILCIVLATNTKFSGVLLFPMMAVLLTGRLLLRWPMRAGKWTLNTLQQRAAFLVVAGVVTVCAFAIGTWAIYGFRFAATTSGKPLKTDWIILLSAINQAQIDAMEHGQRPLPQKEAEAVGVQAALQGELPAVVRSCASWINSRVLPEGWLFGFMYTYVSTMSRQTFLLGHLRQIGWWYYFPAAMLFKTPTATLAIFCIVPVAWLAGRLLQKNTEPNAAEMQWASRWAGMALAIPAAIYMAAAMTTNLNLGLRHVLPVYPFLYISVAVGFAWVMRCWPRAMLVIGLLALLGLAAESIAAYPNYIPFFNFPSGGSRGGIDLLTDSNLDWGQDLPAIVRWQQQHPKDKLYLTYFGPGDPASYGIRCINLPGGAYYEPRGSLDEPGVVAISATCLQGVRFNADHVADYLEWMDPLAAHQVSQIENETERNQACADAFRHLKPREVLNGSIYLFDWPKNP